MQKSKQSSIKRFALLSMVVVLMAPFLVGCADFFFERQSQKDAEQIVASIPIKAQKLVDVNGVELANGDTIYAERTIRIRKGTLVQEFNRKASQLMQEQGMTYEKAVRISLDDLIYDEIEQAFVEIEFARGEASKLLPKEAALGITVVRQGVQWLPLVEDGVADSGTDFVNINSVLRQVYQALQDEIFRVGNEILVQRGEPARPSTSQPDPVAPPHPVPDPEDREKVPEPKLWTSEYFPGDNVDPYFASLDRAAFRRVLNTLEKNLDSDFRLSNLERNDQRAQIKVVNDLVVAGKFKQAYDQLGKDLLELEQQSVLYWSVGQAAFRAVRQEVFGKYLSEMSENAVTSTQVQERYRQMLDTQKLAIDNDPTSFNSFADSENDDLVLYEPTSELFWVKHVLLPFDDQQAAQLKALQSSSSGVGEKKYNEIRQGLADNIKVRRKVNGYQVGEPIAANLIYNEISSIMKPLQGNTFEANKAFDEFIYTYNSDGGLFKKLHRGYMVQPGRNNGAKPGDEKFGLDLQWVIEFARAAKDFKDAYDELGADGLSILGSISGPVVTDNGIHILYFSDTTRGGLPNGRVLSLDEFATASRQKTVRQTIVDLLVKEQQATVRKNWRANVLIGYNPTVNAVRHDNAFRDIWERI